MNLLKNKIEYIKRNSQELKFYDILDYIESTEEYNLKSRYIDIAVIGRFKSGKSSLINSIIAKDILPTGVVPLTTVAVSVSHGDNFAKVVFEDGKTEIIDISMLEDYVSEEKNPANIKSVLRVEVFISLEEELRFFRFIDTPGLDYSQIHNRITEKLYHSLECVVFCVSYDMPISESELKTIELLKKFAPEIVIVVTKVDLIDKNEIKKLISFLRSRVKDTNIYPFSKNDPFLIEDFRREVLLKYSKNYSKSKDAIIKKRYEIIEKSFLTYLKTMLKTLDEDFKKREDFLLFFEEEKKRLKDFEINILEISKRIKTDNTTKIMNKFISYYEYFYRDAYDLLINHILNNSKNLSQLSNNYEKLVRKFLEDAIYYLLEKEQDFISYIISNSILNLTKISNDFLNTTISRLKETIGIDLPILSFEEKKLDITWSKRIFIKVFDINIDFLLPFLPINLIKGFLLKKLKSDLSFDIEKALTRASMDIAESINKEVDFFVKSVLDGLKNKFNTIENIIFNKNLERKRIEEMIYFLTK